jgi:hypothetical protein
MTRPECLLRQYMPFRGHGGDSLSCFSKDFTNRLCKLDATRGMRPIGA